MNGPDGFRPSEAAVHRTIPVVHAIQAAEVQVGSAAARQIVLELHSSNRGRISRRSLADVLALQWSGLPLLRLEYLPHFGDAETARQHRGGCAGVRRRAAATERAPYDVACGSRSCPHRGARDEVQSSRVQRSARQRNGSGRHGPRNEPLRNVANWNDTLL